MVTAAALADKIKAYNPAVDAESIQRAEDFAKKMHEGQTRSSGEPYYTHPMEVASILADLKLDQGSIVTAILHDTLEDTAATNDDLEKNFGKEVAILVNGVSKLTKIESQTVEGKQAENFRKLVLAMSEDIRVLLVKLADRLHNMRTLEHVKPEKRRRIARETLEIYAPLAERIGVHRIKEELEDLAFSSLNPEARESITNRLDFLRSEGSNLVSEIIGQLTKVSKEAGIEAEITGREKTRYSIWKKMQRKNISFEQLSDIMAFRIVVKDIAECYHMLGIIHSKYPTVPGRFKDFISTPKPNGYRSIHTTVIGPDNNRIEIQIRTSDMHEEADLGVAAHWAYKQDSLAATLKDAKKYRWLRELLDIIEQDQKPEDFLENTKLELFQDQVYVFTPKGDLIELPSGSTPVDFAYAIHSNVGDKTVASKINGRIAPLNTKLQNGDQVEVTTTKNGTPSPTWERFVVTGKAKSHIRRYVRAQQRIEYISLGKALLQKTFRTEGYEFTEKAVAGVVQQLEMEELDDVYAGIGSGNLTARAVFLTIFPGHIETEYKKDVLSEAELGNMGPAKRASGKEPPMPIVGLVPGMAVHYARCCHPLPGDRIVGIVTTGKGITIHTNDCETLEQFADTPERWIDVSWGEGKDTPESHVGRLLVTINNKPGALGTLSTVIAKSAGNITNLKITNRTIDFWDMLIDVYVTDIKHLNNVIAALRATNAVVSVERARGR
ncbi:MAG: RelA/SpoT family protein [Alphaproteobacteria bacterium]|nr:RelA/SpoT family protein [Alphaproteobacteria bacterium]